MDYGRYTVVKTGARRFSLTAIMDERADVRDATVKEAFAKEEQLAAFIR